MTTELQIAFAARDRFRNVHMKTGDALQLFEWLTEKAQHFADCVAREFEKSTELTHDDMVEFFLDFYAYGMDDFYIENGALYQTITRRIQ